MRKKKSDTMQVQPLTAAEKRAQIRERGNGGAARQAGSLFEQLNQQRLTGAKKAFTAIHESGDPGDPDEVNNLITKVRIELPPEGIGDVMHVPKHPFTSAQLPLNNNPAPSTNTSQSYVAGVFGAFMNDALRLDKETALRLTECCVSLDVALLGRAQKLP